MQVAQCIQQSNCNLKTILMTPEPILLFYDLLTWKYHLNLHQHPSSHTSPRQRLSPTSTQCVTPACERRSLPSALSGGVHETTEISCFYWIAPLSYLVSCHHIKDVQIIPACHESLYFMTVFEMSWFAHYISLHLLYWHICLAAISLWHTALDESECLIIEWYTSVVLRTRW